MTTSKVLSKYTISCLILWIFASQVSSSEREAETLGRNKRDVLQLADIIRSCTGRDANDYNGYGCYCGYGGSGTPVDDVDRCCQTHDNCYTSTSCPVTHIVTYNYRCNGCDCQCFDPPGECKREACQCDIEFGRCLASAGYNPANKKVDCR